MAVLAAFLMEELGEREGLVASPAFFFEGGEQGEVVLTFFGAFFLPTGDVVLVLCGGAGLADIGQAISAELIFVEAFGGEELVAVGALFFCRRVMGLDILFEVVVAAAFFACFTGRAVAVLVVLIGVEVCDCEGALTDVTGFLTEGDRGFSTFVCPFLHECSLFMKVAVYAVDAMAVFSARDMIKGGNGECAFA